MTSAVPTRLPGPAAAAALIAGLLGVFAGWNLLAAVTATSEALTGSGPSRQQLVVLYAVLTVGLGYVCLGTIQGWRPAQALGAVAGVLVALGGLYVATVPNLAVRLLGYDRIGLLAALVGVVLIGLLVVPQTSRDWFAYKR